MRVSSLGSGSKGNATLIEAGEHQVLVDCGFGLKEAEGRLRARGVEPGSLSGIFVTHEHGDHIKGAPMLANKYHIPLWSTHGTARHLKRAVPTARQFWPHESIQIGGLAIEPVTVPHDSAEPSQFVFRYQSKTVGVLTDLGSLTSRVVEAFQRCDLLLLECNHDPEMLAVGPYPPSLKRRVGGNFGHLSNDQAAELLHRIDRSGLKQVLVSHISEQNNDPSLALDTIAPALADFDVSVQLLTQAEGCDWLTV